MKGLIYVILGIAIMTTSCRSIEKMVDRGDYDEAIVFAAKKLNGKKNKKTKHVQGLEEAFAKITQRDMQEIAYLKDRNRPENWDKIIAIYNKMNDRQNRIYPFLPLISKDGYEADFRFVKVDKEIKDAMAEASKYHYDRAQRLLVTARRGDKRDARSAYDALLRLEQYYRHYKDTDQLKKEARALGTERILVAVENHAHAIIPHGFERELESIDLAFMNSKWKTYYTSTPSNMAIDYHATLKIRTLDVSPERETINHFVDTKEIQDGWNYVLDRKGNVVKDTLGNDIKTPNKVMIRADVIEIFREKMAVVEGKLEFVDAYNKQLIKSLPISVNAGFEDYTCTYTGDRRALRDKTRKRVKNHPLPFPTDHDMVWQSAEELKNAFKENLSRL